MLRLSWGTDNMGVIRKTYRKHPDVSNVQLVGSVSAQHSWNDHGDYKQTLQSVNVLVCPPQWTDFKS